jgi:hypothetical protein
MPTGAVDRKDTAVLREMAVWSRDNRPEAMGLSDQKPSFHRLYSCTASEPIGVESF